MHMVPSSQGERLPYAASQQGVQAYPISEGAEDFHRIFNPENYGVQSYPISGHASEVEAIADMFKKEQIKILYG